jgi:hypothetical protein
VGDVLEEAVFTASLALSTYRLFEEHIDRDALVQIIKDI